MANTYKVTTSLPCVSALPRDDSDNTLFYHFASAPTSADFDALGGVIRDFYTQFISGGTNRVKDYLATDRDHGANLTKTRFYLLPATPGPIGTPVHQFNWTLTAPTSAGANLPQQVAVVNSYHQSLVGVVNPKRLRGRIYLGPLNTLALQNLSTVPSANTVAAIMQQDVTKASKQYLLTAAAAIGWEWVQFSPTAWLQGPVVGGHVDDRFDTQRRRLQRTTGRTTWT